MHTKFYTAIFKEREHSGDTVEDRMALKYDQGTQFEKKNTTKLALFITQWDSLRRVQ